tara:strand:- start:11318 stop:11728 length:411 start_codon:yes stop_codon:yes gene_type:complete
MPRRDEEERAEPTAKKVQKARVSRLRSDHWSVTERLQEASLARLEGREPLRRRAVRWLRQSFGYRRWLEKLSGKLPGPAVDQSEEVDQVIVEGEEGEDENEDDDDDDEDEDDRWAGVEWEGDYTFILEEYERAWTL